MSSQNEELMAKRMNTAPTGMSGVDVTASADPFSPRSDHDEEWDAITAREQLTWGADLTDTDETATED
ncbi:hypothetical protein CIK61_17660 [Brevibacterium aurantiacum]|uniref:hypothetical protein n=1 Tax=Brevibacterium aurantiacum TaxID=273384 RepID=UPI000DF2447D|nr:hypothetical protein [Brevibacterium aurantiacum]RCS91623.1 hypothetical protein CIK61_17660 [Brevibacterium aurantiacum]